MDKEDLPVSQHIISDLGGFAGVAKALIGPIAHGVGSFLGPWKARRDATTQIGILGNYSKAFEQLGLSVKSADLEITDRTRLRVLAEQITAQENREAIAHAAIEHSERLTPIADVSAPTPEWLSQFWSLAQHVTEESMQSFWGLLLARRSVSGSNISARTLNFLSMLSGEEARALERISSFAVQISDNGKVNMGILQSLVVPSANKSDIYEISEDIRRYVEPLRTELFTAIGIYNGATGTHYIGFGGSGPRKEQINISDRKFELVVDEQNLSENKEFAVGVGVGFTPLGTEIVNIIRPPADEGYVGLLVHGLNARGLKVTELPQEGS